MLPIYIVSLEKDVVRRKILDDLLSSWGLDYQFIHAVYGKDLTQKDIENYRFNEVIARKGYTPTLGEIGCTLSHIKLYKQFIESHQQWACVLEDDAIVDERFAHFCKKFDPQNPSGADQDKLYLLGGQKDLGCARYVAYSYWYGTTIAGQHFSKTIKSENHIHRACCYLINPTLARRILSLFEKQFFIADEWNWFLNRGVFKNIYIADFVEHPMDRAQSNIEPERIAKKITADAVKYRNNNRIKSRIKKIGWLKKVRHHLLIARAKLRAFYI